MSQSSKANFKVDFIGIGVPRAGTSWINRCLKEHPEICLSCVKETHFFYNFLSPEKERDLASYKKYFSHCPSGKIIGEFTPYYFSAPKAAHRIKEALPEVKLIACLRNPIERIYSSYFFWKYRGKHNYQTFEEFLEKEKFGAKEEGFYFTHLQRFLKLFPRENILVLFYEDIDENPLKFVRTIFEFLGVNKDFIPSSLNYRVNPGRDSKGWLLSRLAWKVIWKLKQNDFGQKIIDKLMESQIKVIFDSLMYRSSPGKDSNKVASRIPMRQETRIYLHNLYKKEIENLEKLLNRNLDFWR